MSLKKVEQVKNSKFFRPWDLIIYGLIFAAAIVLILVFALTGRGKSEGFIISYRGEKIFSYSFAEDGYEIISPNVEVEEDGEEKLLLVFRTDGGRGYNQIEVDKAAQSVKVTDSDCSAHRDCVYTAALSPQNRAPILCTPHALAITPLEAGDDGKIRT